MNNLLNDELKKLYKSDENLFPKERIQINEEIIEEIFSKILSNINSRCKEEKRIFKEYINSQKDGWEEKSLEAKKIIQSWIINKLKKENAQRDKIQIQNLIKNLLISNEDRRIRTVEFRAKLEKLTDNQFNNYDLVKTRQIVSSTVKDMREKFKKEKFKNGFIVSKETIKRDNDIINKIDGWQYTKNKNLIKEYCENEISSYKRAIESFNHSLEILDEE